MRVLTWFGIAAVCSCFGGCGKSDGAEPVARGDLAAELAKAACDSLAKCCQQESFAFDAATCRSNSAAELQQELDDDENNGPNIGYDAQAAGDCLAAFSGAVFCGSTDNAPEPDTCKKIFVGKLVPGASCSRSAECARPAKGSAHCDITDGETGVCVQDTSGDAEHGKSGEPCAGTCDGDDCGSIAAPVPVGGADPNAPTALCYRNEGLACGIDQVCAPLAAAMSACFGTETCKNGLFCDLTQGLCVKARANGELCNGDDQCASDNCDDDSGACSERTVSQQTCNDGPFK